MKSTGRHVVIAGGAGFLGNHLVRDFLSSGDHVTVLDNFSTGNRHCFDDLSEPQLKLVEHDVCDPPPTAPCDLLINLACPASPAYFQAAPIDTWRASVLGALNLSEMALRHNARFVQASTSEVYGDPEVHPQPESYVGHVNCVGPRACYDEGKRAAETFLLDLQRTRGLDVRVARIFNTYGPGMALEDGRVVSNFLLQALQGKPLTVYGDGSQTRSYCYVSDTVRGLRALCEIDGLQGEVVNIGNPREFSVRELAELVGKISGRDVTLASQAAAPHDPRQRCPDISRARTVLGWNPVISLEEGLHLMFADIERRIAPAAS